MSVVHSHAPAALPYAVSTQPLRAVVHTAGFLGAGVPVFEIRDERGEATICSSPTSRSASR